MPVQNGSESKWNFVVPAVLTVPPSTYATADISSFFYIFIYFSSLKPQAGNIFIKPTQNDLRIFVENFQVFQNTRSGNI